MQMLLKLHCVLPNALPSSQNQFVDACSHRVRQLPRILVCRLRVEDPSLVRQRPFLARASAQDGFQDRRFNPTENRRDDDTSENTSAFCIIEGPETVQDFASLQLQDIRDSIRTRRNKIFLLMEEVRRLRIQQKIKSAEHEIQNDDNEMPNFPSFIPFLPPLTTTTLKQYYIFCFGLVAAIILFGGLLAPMLELKLGLGGTSYKDFIRSMHLPPQLSEVDPIVASFSGGAVGVISSLMVVEMNNAKLQEQKRCRYCLGTGYLACARCSGTGALVMAEAVSTAGKSDKRLRPLTNQRCPNCSGAARVMCPTCLCTGMEMASEHDPRIDPFD
ncbi:hypothetical protein L7F22_033296 [Adiantum nelumboides]|nr:hypothetical protein [Adiantum nelumboides]